MSIQISSDAFNQSIGSSLTNEVPHLSIYDLLNKQIRMSWSRELIGKTETKYDSRTSTKLFEGYKSKNYFPEEILLSDPDTNRILLIKKDKIDFSVSGFLETEIDYLMHENDRYLSKLYPDGFYSLITLTESERQSYFNEAGHLIHSYFDTENIWDSTEENRFYFRYKFLNSITPVRGLTGSINQEENLINLLNVGNFNVYSGYKFFADSLGFGVYSNHQENTDSYDSVNLYSYEFYSKEQFKQILNGKLKGYVLEDGDLSNFLDYYNKGIFLNSALDTYLRPLWSLGPLLETWVSGSLRKAINEYIKENVLGGLLNVNATLETLIDDDSAAMAEKGLSIPGLGETKNYFIKSVNSENVIPINGIFNISSILNAANNWFIDGVNLRDIRDLNVLQLGEAKYTDLFKLAAGNLISDHLVLISRTTENFKEICFSAVRNNKMNLVFSLRRDLRDEAEKEKEISKLRSLEKKVDEYLDLMDQTEGEYGMDYPYQDDAAWHKYLNSKNDNFLLISFGDLSDCVSMAYKYVDAGKYRTAKKCLNFIFEELEKGSIFQKEILYGVLNKNFLSNVENNIISVEKTLSLNPTKEYSLDEVASSIEKVEGIDDILFEFKASSYLRVYSVITNTEIKLGDLFDYSELEKDKIATIERSNLELYFDKKSKLAQNPNRLVDGNYYNMNILDLEVIQKENLYTLFNENSYYLFEEHFDESSGAYKWYNRYVTKISDDTLKKDLDSINENTVTETFFLKTKIGLGTMSTAKCSFYSEDIYKVEGNGLEFYEEVLKNHRLKIVLRDNYGNFYPGVIYKTWKKDNAYYFEDLYPKKLNNLENSEGYMMANLNILEDGLGKFTKKEAPTSLSKRKINSSKVYKNDQKFIFYKSWGDLKRENLNFIMNNIACKSPTVYRDEAPISKATKIPAELFESSWITIVDSNEKVNKEDTFNQIKGLLKENKSLYIDSSLKFIKQIAFSEGNLIYTENYDALGFMIKSTPPAYATFYNTSSYENYTELADMLDFIDAGKKENPSIEELEEFYNRRKIVWGNVIWDANDNNRSIKNLRTIWSGYFSNFEIYSSSDVIPSEADILSLPGKRSSADLQILNYNYAYNNGNPDLQWSMAVSANAIGANFSEKMAVDLYSHKPILDEKSKYALRESIISLKEFYQRVNVLSEDEKVFTNIKAKIKYKNLIIPKGKIYFEITNGLAISVDGNNHIQCSLKGETDSGYKSADFKFINNMFYIDDTFIPVGFLNSVINNRPFEMILEFFVTKYYMDHTGIEYFTEENLIEYAETIEESNVSLEDILLYFENNVTSPNPKKTNGRPCVYVFSLMKSSGKAENYYIVIRVKRDSFSGEVESINLEGGSFLENCTADLFDSFSDESTVYPVTTGERSVVLESVNKNQVINSTGEMTGYFKNTDLQLTSLDFDENNNCYKYEDGSNHRIYLNGELAENDSYEVKNYFKDLYNKSVTYDSKNSIITINDFEYKLSDNDIYFKEYQDAQMEFFVDDGIESSDTEMEIKKHSIRIKTDLDLRNKGNLYVYNIRALNKRSSYSPEREILLIDRKYTLTNLRVDSFDIDKNLITLRDSYLGNQRVEKEAKVIKPLYTEKKVQKINDDTLRLGKMWKEPSTKIGYTFYKRKFIFEGTIYADDLKTIIPADENFLGEKDNLTNHVSVGDKVELILLDPPSVYADSRGSAVVHDSRVLKGPFKKIYEDSTTLAASKLDTEPSAVNRAIFSGRGIILTVVVNLTKNNIQITTYNSTHDNQNVTFFVSNGKIYIKDLDNNNSWQFAILVDFLEDGSTNETQEALAPKPETVLISNTETGDESEGLSFDSSEFEGSDDLINQGLVNSHEEEEWEKLDAADSIVDTIALQSGTLYFTDSDKMYFTPSEAGVNSFKDHPAKADYADFSGYYDSIVVEENLVPQLKKIEECTEEQLKNWVTDALQEYFYSFKEEETAGVAPSVSDSYTIPNFQQVTDEPSSLNPNPKAEYEIGIDNQGPRRLAIVLTGGSEGQKVYFNENTVTVPKITIEDTPVYSGLSQTPKWKKSFILERGNTLLKDAGFDQLKQFCRSLLNIRYVTRKQINVSTWAKSKNNIVAWDQTSGIITLMDSTGKVIEKISSPYLGYEAPNSYKLERNSNGELNGQVSPAITVANTVPNTIFIKEPASEVFSMEKYEYNDYSEKTGVKGKYTQSEYGIYSLFMEGQLLDLCSLAQGTGEDLNLSYLNSMPSIKVNGETLTFAKVLRSREEYNRYLKYMYYVDYMNVSAYHYISLRNPDSWFYYGNLEKLIKKDTIKNSTEWKLFASRVSNFSMEIPKGTPYISYEQYLNGNCNVLKEGSDALVSFSQDTEILCYTSLVRDSGLSVSGNVVKIYGTIEWPILGDEDDPGSFLGKFKSQYEQEAISSEMDEDETKEYVSNKLTALRTQLQKNYNTFTTGDYEGGDKPFVITFDIDEYTMGPVSIQKTVDKGDIVGSFIENGDNFEAYTPNGKYDAGSGSQAVIQPETDGVKLLESDIKLLDLLKQMKTATSNVEIVNTGSSTGEIRMRLRGSLTQNPTIMYSRIESMDKQSITLEDFGLMMNEGETNAVVLIEDHSKDNFQFGFGNVTGLENITPQMSLFKVNVSDYADFATYENSFSRSSDNRRPRVFDLYPTWEKISEERRGYFYKTEEDGSVSYLRNTWRNILRISDFYNSAPINCFIYKNGSTVAGEQVNLEDHFSDSNFESYKNSYVIDDTKLRGMSFLALKREYGNLQYVPALADDPLSSIRNYAYNVASFKIDQDFNNYVEVLDDYREDNNLETMYLDLHIKLLDAPTDFINSDDGEVSLIDLDLWIENISENLPLYKKITDYPVTLGSGENKNAIIGSDYINEIVFPEKGYGQALMGGYKNPSNNLFEDGVFFHKDYETLNKSGETLHVKKLVTNGSGTIVSIEELENVCPALVYRSFKEADFDLDSELTTVDPIDEEFTPFILELDKYEIEGNTLSFNYKDLYPKIYGETSEDVSYSIKNLFSENLQFGCRLIWSESTIDESSIKVGNFSKIGIVGDKELFTQNDLINSLGYTRMYIDKKDCMPTWEPYLDSDNNLCFTDTSYSKDFSTRMCNEDGLCVGISYDETTGSIEKTTRPGKNGFLHGIKKYCPNSDSTKVLSEFSISSLGVSSSLLRLKDFMRVSNKCMKADFLNKRIYVSSEDKSNTFIIYKDPNDKQNSILFFNEIKNVTLTKKGDNSLVEMWGGKKETFSIKFNSLKLGFYYKNTFKNYNFIYLKDKDMNVVAKVFVKDGINANDLLVFSMI